MIIRSLKWINAGINNYISNRPLYTLIWLISGIVLFVFWDFLTFQKLYLFHDIGSDTLNASLPKFYHISQYLREYGVPGWSFNQGMGQNIYPFSIGDPFNFILYLFGAPYLVFVIAYVEILKIFLFVPKTVKNVKYFFNIWRHILFLLIIQYHWRFMAKLLN